MDKNRVFRTRRGSMLAGEKDRQKRPGTPHRNYRPVNLTRASESAVPLHGSYSDHSDEEDFHRNDKSKKNEESLQRRLKNENPTEETAFLQASNILGVIDTSSESHGCLAAMAKSPTAVSSASSIPRGTGEIERNAVFSQRSRTRLIKNKSNQATNTTTTFRGLPPLDGIHAGVGVGQQYCEVLYDNVDSLNDVYNLSEDEEEREFQKNAKRIEVPSSLVFESSCDSRHSFGAVITIRNTSEFFMTYCVKTSEPEMFVITPSIGMIDALGKCEIYVNTNPKFEFTFKDIATEVFKIFATPVYTRSQMKLDKLQVLWRACGTDFFPRIAAEEHTINFLYQYFPKYTTESLLSAISCNHRWLSSLWANDKPVSIVSDPISEEEFYSVWPLEDDQYNFMTCKNQIDGWCWYLKSVKQQTNLLKYEIRQCVAISILFLFVSLLVYSSFNPIPASYRMSQYFHMFNWGNNPTDSETTVMTPSETSGSFWEWINGCIGLSIFNNNKS